jgi:hypothetical protein
MLKVGQTVPVRVQDPAVSDDGDGRPRSRLGKEVEEGIDTFFWRLCTGSRGPKQDRRAQEQQTY